MFWFSPWESPGYAYSSNSSVAADDYDDDDDNDDVDKMSVVDTGTVNERVFLDDNTFANDQTRQTPLDLGAFPHQCVGNVTLCPNGFTWAFWYKPQPANRQVT